MPSQASRLPSRARNIQTRTDIAGASAGGQHNRPAAACAITDRWTSTRLARSLGFPKPAYTVVERERRWLCRAVPRELIVRTETIVDLYVTGARLRLREARPHNGDPAMLRLSRKADVDPRTRLVTSIYLPEQRVRRPRRRPAGAQDQETAPPAETAARRRAVGRRVPGRAGRAADGRGRVRYAGTHGRLRHARLRPPRSDGRSALRRRPARRQRPAPGRLAATLRRAFPRVPK